MSCPLSSKSSVNAGFPFTKRTASTFTSGLPTTAISGTSFDGTTLGTAGEASGPSSSGLTSTGFFPSVRGGRYTGPKGSFVSPRIKAAARMTASTGLTYAVSRSRIPESISLTSCSVGLGFRLSNSHVPSIIAGVEYPDCIAPVATNAAWIGWSSGLLNHSTVRTSWPSIWAANMQSVLVSLPSIRTAPAPVSPESEPYRTLIIPRRRNSCSSVS